MARQRHRDHRPLPHPPAQLVRILVDRPVRQRHPHQVQHLDRQFARRLLVQPLVQPDRFSDLVPDRVYRAQRRHRLLKDHRDLRPADIAHLVALCVHLGQIDDLLLAPPPAMV